MVRTLGTGFQLIIAILVGRELGAEAIGYFYVYRAWYVLIGTVASLGLPFVALKQISRLVKADSKVELEGAISSYLVLGILLSGGLCFAFLLSAEPLAKLLAAPEHLSPAIQIAAISGFGLSVVRIIAEILKALGDPDWGLAIEHIIPSAGLSMALLGGRGFSLQVSQDSLPYLHAASVLIGLAIGATLISRHVRIRLTVPAISDLGLRPRSLGAFTLISLMNNAVGSIPYLILPAFADQTEIGRFGVAHRLVAVSGTLISALAAYFSPLFSQYSGSGEMGMLRRTYRRSQIYSLVLYLPLLIAFLLGGDWLLTVFGSDFSPGRAMLTIMALGRLITASLGLTEHLLNMSGFEIWELSSATASIGLMVGVSLLFGRQLGAEGVAVAYAVSFSFRSAVSTCIIRGKLFKRVGVQSEAAQEDPNPS